jgi:aspartate/methionine/tyrosine aminotransferase
MADRLLMEADVCVLSGTSFGGVGADHIRISYANSQANLSKALDRIRAFVEGLAPVAVGAGSSR